MNAMTTAASSLAAPSAAAGLAGCYQMLGIAFAYPEEDLFETVLDGSFLAALSDAVKVALPAWDDPFQARMSEFSLPPETTLTAFASDYLSIFELDTPKPALSLYEGSYATGSDRSEILLEVKTFYQHFGLAVSEDLREPEDHLAAELEFMQFLAAKQASAESLGMDPSPYVRAQRDFLGRHLARWLPGYAAAAQSMDHDFYRALSWFTTRLVAEHLAMLELPASAVEGAAP